MVNTFSDPTRRRPAPKHSLLAVTCGLTAGLLLACSSEASDSASGSSVSPGGSGLNSGGDPALGTAGTGAGSVTGTGTAGAGTGVGNEASNGDINGLNVSAPVSPIDMSCIQEGVEIETLTPTVELLVDRSGSMDANFGTLDRWNTIRNVLVDPATGFVKTMEDKVRFGLTLYTGIKADTDLGTPASCADLIQVPNAFSNFQMIHDVFMANEIGDDTPTAESLIAVTAKLEAVVDIGPKVIVLATDGDPDSCADPGANGSEPPRAASVAAVEAAWGKGISTYVISVGADVTATHLQDLATAGNGGVMASYYEALDTTALVDAFGTILRGVQSCDFELNGTVTPENAPRGTVSIDGTPLVYGDPNGWELVGMSTVRLLGTACDSVKLSVDFVDINFPCGVISLF